MKCALIRLLFKRQQKHLLRGNPAVDIRVQEQLASFEAFNFGSVVTDERQGLFVVTQYKVTY